MTLTFSEAGRNVLGNRYAVLQDITLDAYVAGGRSITAANVGLAVIEAVRQAGGNAAAAKYRYHWDRVNAKLVVLAGGDSQQSYAFADAKGATNPAGATEANTDQAAAPVNSTLLMSAATITSLALTATATANPDVPRNVMITIINDTGGNLDLYEGVTTFVITGTDINGAAQTENVTLTSTAGNKTMAHAPDYRYVQGVKAFATVTSVTWNNAPAATMKLSLGIGSRIGLPKPLASAAATDVLDIAVTAARVAPTATVTSAGGVDTTNNTINAGTTADAWDFEATWKATGEVAAGADLSAVIPRLEFVGY